MKDNTEKIIEEVNATMRFEGLSLTEDDKEMLRKCLEEESTFEKERVIIIQKI